MDDDRLLVDYDNGDDQNNRDIEEEGDGLRTIGNWTAYRAIDADGGDEENLDGGAVVNYYYANSVTGESTWDAPPGFEDLAALATTASLLAPDDDEDGRIVGVGGEVADDDDDKIMTIMNDEDNSATIAAAIAGTRNLMNDNINYSNDDDDDEIVNNSNNSSFNNNNNTNNIDDGEEIGNGWVAYKDDEHRIYYYNNTTGETQWDRPGEEEIKDNDDDDDEELGGEKDEEEEEDDRNYDNDNDEEEAIMLTTVTNNEHGGMFNVDDNDINQHRNNVEQQQQLHDKEEQQKESSSSSYSSANNSKAIIRQSEQLLQQPDAIMESNVLSIITTLVNEQGPTVAGPKAIQYLIQGYVGNTAICGILGQWLARLKSSSLSSKKTRNDTTNNNNDNDNNNSNDNNSNNNYCLHESTTNIVRDIVTDVITKLAKERFTKHHGDIIISLNKKNVSFIDTMIHSSRWRQLLIDLSATNMDSKLFMFCLQSISNLGYHREIANRINPSEFFGVFDSMLQSELIIAGTMAVDGYYLTTTNTASSGVEDGVGDGTFTNATTTITSQTMTMGTFISDLRRNCTSTSYTYLYAMEVIGKLLIMANKRLLNIVLASKDDDDDNNNSSGSNTNHHQKTTTTTPVTATWFMRAIMKWERLRDEVEDEMLLHPPKTGTTFQRKRRIDMAITISNLYQRKRHRVDPRLIRNSSTYADEKNNNNNNNMNNIARCNTLDVAIIQLITKNGLGMPIDKEVLDNILKYAYGGSTDRIGELLLQHTTAITALLNHLFSPIQRIRLLDTRMKCARLVALAVIAALRRTVATTEGGDGGGGMQVEALPQESNNDTDDNDEDGLIQIILKGSQLCEQLENVVSFTVIDSIINNNTNNNNNNTVEERSIGRQLSSMCIKHSVISHGFLIWAKVQSSGVDFVETANYTSVSPCILCLTKLICRYHPLSRPTALEIALIFLGHSNREISSQKMQSIKEQCLRLLLWLSTQGMSLAVLSVVQNRLDKNNKGVGSSSCETLDSSLVRYFFIGLMDIIRPPFSIAFVRAFGGLLLIGPCVDALQSKLVDVSTRENIARLVSQFEAGSVLREDDKLLLSKLKAVYG